MNADPLSDKTLAAMDRRRGTHRSMADVAPLLAEVERLRRENATLTGRLEVHQGYIRARDPVPAQTCDCRGGPHGGYTCPKCRGAS